KGWLATPRGPALRDSIGQADGRHGRRVSGQRSRHRGGESGPEQRPRPLEKRGLLTRAQSHERAAQSRSAQAGDCWQLGVLSVSLRRAHQRGRGLSLSEADDGGDVIRAGAWRASAHQGARMSVVFLPVLRTAVSYSVSFGRRWSILEHMLLKALASDR